MSSEAEAEAMIRPYLQEVARAKWRLRALYDNLEQLRLTEDDPVYGLAAEAIQRYWRK